MANADEMLLKFQVAQLEGRLAIYETLISEISKLSIIEQVAASVKLRLEDVIAVLAESNLERDNAGGA